MLACTRSAMTPIGEPSPPSRWRTGVPVANVVWGFMRSSAGSWIRCRRAKVAGRRPSALGRDERGAVDAAVQHAVERPHDVGAELVAGHAEALLPSLVQPPRPMVRPLAGHDVPGIGDGHDARPHWYLVPGQPARI